MMIFAFAHIHSSIFYENSIAELKGGGGRSLWGIYIFPG